MMVMQKTLVHIDLLIALSRRTLTIAAELVEIIMVLWYFPECKIAIISTSYAYMSMS